MTVQLDTRIFVKQSLDQVSCELDKEIVILNLKSSLYFGLKDVGAYLWEVLKEPRSVGDVCELVLAKFDVSREQCYLEIPAFLSKLEEAGLLECSPDGACSSEPEHGT